MAAQVIQFARVAPVCAALRARARHDGVPAGQFQRARDAAFQLLDEGRSAAVAFAEGCRAMRPVRPAALAPQGGAA